MDHGRKDNRTNIIKVPQLAWHGPKDLELSFPDGWKVDIYNMAGFNRPAMNDDQIRASVTNPIGMPPLREFAKGKKEVVIIFDDITRVTRISRIIPYVLEELAEAGIPDSKIRFIAALGNHGAMDRAGFAKKLGEATLARFPVYNHNPYENCVYVGTTTRGTKLFVNAEVMHCDLKIAISAVTPHPGVMFGGGGKMILPGVSSIESIIANHSLPRGDYDTNQTRLDMEEIAKFASLDVVIESIVNLWGESVAILAGAETVAHEAAVKEAKAHYLCPKAEGKDIVIANTYAKVMESVIGVKTATSLAQKGGSLVIIANTPEGQVVHYLGGPWGRGIAGRRPVKFPVASNVDRLIVYTEYSDLSSLAYFDSPQKILQMSNWNDVIRTLQGFHGDSATVAVYPNADIMYSK